MSNSFMAQFSVGLFSIFGSILGLLKHCVWFSQWLSLGALEQTPPNGKPSSDTIPLWLFQLSVVRVFMKLTLRFPGLRGYFSFGFIEFLEHSWLSFMYLLSFEFQGLLLGLLRDHSWKAWVGGSRGQTQVSCVQDNSGSTLFFFLKMIVSTNMDF